MRLKPKPFQSNQIYSHVFDSEYPTITIYPFIQSRIEKLNQLPVNIQLKSQIVLDELPVSKVLSDVVVGIKNTKLSDKDKSTIFFKLSPIINDLIFREASKYLVSWKNYFDTNILELTKQTKSKFQWEIAKSIGISALFQAPYSYEQKMWIVCANYTAKFADQKFIIDMVESLKPWINNELYHAIKKSEDNKKQNTLFEKQRAEMLEGSFGMSENDQKLLDSVKQQDSTNIPDINNIDDLDIIN